MTRNAECYHNGQTQLTTYGLQYVHYLTGTIFSFVTAVFVVCYFRRTLHLRKGS